MKRTIKNIIAFLLCLSALLIMAALTPRHPAWLYWLVVGLTVFGAIFAMSAVIDMLEEQKLRDMFNEPDEHRDNAVG